MFTVKTSGRCDYYTGGEGSGEYYLWVVLKAKMPAACHPVQAVIIGNNCALSSATRTSSLFCVLQPADDKTFTGYIQAPT